MTTSKDLRIVVRSDRGRDYDLAGNLDLVRLPTCVDAGATCLFSLDYGYDGADRLVEVKDAVGNRTINVYDTEGNRTREELRDPNGVLHRFTNFAFDSLNRLRYAYFNDIVPEDPNSIFWKFGHDDDGNRTSEQDPESHLTTYAYDEMNRLVTVAQTVGATPVVTQYGYDVQDNLASVTDPRGLQTTYVTSDAGTRLRVTSPDTGVTSNLYDPAGNLISSTDNRGVVTTRTYDALDRPLTVTYPTSALNVTYSYDSPAVSFGVGRRTGMTDPSGSTVFQYDRRGLLVREEKTINTVTYVTEYEHDKNGNETRILYPSPDPFLRRGEVDFVFDAADRLTSATVKVNGSLTSVASGITYEPFGPTASIPFANGRTDVRTFDTRYRLGSWTLSGLLSYTHIFNNDDNLTARMDAIDPNNNRSFSYDETHRLVGASGPWGAGTGCAGITTYTYDLNGNRTCKGESGASTTYSYDPGSNRILTALGGEPASYSHDAAGNVTGDGVHTYQFDDSGRLAQVDGGTTATCTYDGDGRRTAKLAGGATTLFFYDTRGKLLTEMVPADQTGKDYLYLGETPLGRVDWSPQELSIGDGLFATASAPNVHLDWTALPAGSNRYVIRRKEIVSFLDKTFNGNVVIATLQDPTRTYDDHVLMDGKNYFYRVFSRIFADALFNYHTDHLGTPLAMTDATGSLVWMAEHRPFGGIHSLPVSTVTNNLRFPGQYADAETGLSQNWFREYDAALGRYREPDPLGQFADLHLYPYVGNNPQRWFDLLGLYRRGDVIYRQHPSGFGEDVTFIWDDPTPDQDGNGDEIIVAFGNPRGCPRTCSGKAQITPIDGSQGPYAGWRIIGSYKPGWLWRASDATYQRRWNSWQQQNPTWTPPGVIPVFQCYTLVNVLTGTRQSGYLGGLQFGPRDLRYWKRRVQ
jgi:RHS repeat-associated protein